MRVCLWVFSISVNLIWSALSVAQDPPRTQDRSAGTPSVKEVKKRQKELYKELGPQDQRWLDEEVADIITPEEREAFRDLSTNEEREQFRESFWDRRNPDPESPINTAKEERYRRLAYADEHFSSGIPGRKTDRGRIYIIWGPSDEIDSHPTGGTYERPIDQGGGQSTAYPWELWRYRHLEGIGENIEIEFVDPTGSSEYHIAWDFREKDALAHLPGAGPSLSEVLGRASKADPFTNSNGTTCPMRLGGVTAANNEFDNLDRNFRIQRAPQHLRGLEEKNIFPRRCESASLPVPGRLPSRNKQHRPGAHHRAAPQSRLEFPEQAGLAHRCSGSLLAHQRSRRPHRSDLRGCDLFLSRCSSLH